VEFRHSDRRSQGGFFFVFMAGDPAFRKYDDKGALVYERSVQGREIDPLVAAISRPVAAA
jgi:hypothetical protein